MPLPTAGDRKGAPLPRMIEKSQLIYGLSHAGESRCAVQLARESIAELVAARLAGGEPCVLVVRTGSMAPLLRPGEAIRVAPLAGQLPPHGAVLVVRQGNFLLTHRLVGRAGEQLLLQGDACLHPDRPVAANAVLGVVVARRRGGCWQRLPERGWRCNGVGSWVFGVVGLLLRRAKTLRPPNPKTSLDVRRLSLSKPASTSSAGARPTSLPNKSIITKEQP